MPTQSGVLALGLVEGVGQEGAPSGQELDFFLEIEESKVRFGLCGWWELRSGSHGSDASGAWLVRGTSRCRTGSILGGKVFVRGQGTDGCVVNQKGLFRGERTEDWLGIYGGPGHVSHCDDSLRGCRTNVEDGLQKCNGTFESSEVADVNGVRYSKSKVIWKEAIGPVERVVFVSRALIPVTE